MLSYIAWLILQPVNFLFIIFGFSSIEGRKNIRNVKGRGIILAANHIHETDPWRIESSIPFIFRRAKWLTASELFNLQSAYALFLEDEDKGAVKALLFSLLGVFLVNFSLTLPINRSSVSLGAIKQARKILACNGIIGIFPEGKIDNKGEFSPGFVRLAMVTGAIILPIKVEKNRLAFGQPIDVAVSPKGDAEMMAKRIMEDIYSL